MNIFVAVSAPPPINYPTDVVFVVDDSESVGSENFTTMKSFLSQIISRLDVDSGKTRVGLVTFATNVGTVFNLTEHSSLKSLQSAISSLSYTGSNATDTAASLDYVRTRMLTEAAGDRDNVHNIVVVITDGRSANFNATVVSTKFAAFYIETCFALLCVQSHVPNNFVIQLNCLIVHTLLTATINSCVTFCSRCRRRRRS